MRFLLFLSLFFFSIGQGVCNTRSFSSTALVKYDPDALANSFRQSQPRVPKVIFSKTLSDFLQEKEEKQTRLGNLLLRSAKIFDPRIKHVQGDLFFVPYDPFLNFHDQTCLLYSHGLKDQGFERLTCQSYQEAVTTGIRSARSKRSLLFLLHEVAELRGYVDFPYLGFLLFNSARRFVGMSYLFPLEEKLDGIERVNALEADFLLEDWWKTSTHRLDNFQDLYKGLSRFMRDYQATLALFLYTNTAELFFNQCFDFFNTGRKSDIPDALSLQYPLLRMMRNYCESLRVTIDLEKDPDLLRPLRAAGFNIFGAERGIAQGVSVTYQGLKLEYAGLVHRVFTNLLKQYEELSKPENPSESPKKLRVCWETYKEDSDYAALVIKDKKGQELWRGDFGSMDGCDIVTEKPSGENGFDIENYDDNTFESDSDSSSSDSDSSSSDSDGEEEQKERESRGLFPGA